MHVFACGENTALSLSPKSGLRQTPMLLVDFYHLCDDKRAQRHYFVNTDSAIVCS